MNTQNQNQPAEDKTQQVNKHDLSKKDSNSAEKLYNKINQSLASTNGNNKKPSSSQDAQSSHKILKAGDSSNNSKQNPMTKKILLFVIPLIIVIIAGIAAILISQKQKTEPGPKAPSAPESKPAAQMESEGCTLYFDVNEPIEPTNTPTPVEPTPEPNSCGYTPCIDDNDCIGNLVCVETTIDEDNNGSLDTYCAMSEYISACQNAPSFESCCTAPITPTTTPSPTLTPTGTPQPTSLPTNTPTSTPTSTPTAAPTYTPIPTSTPAPNGPQTYVVQTETGCNSPCTVNSDCDNLSHICYNGRCRLDVNPEDEYCRLPSGETTVERIVEQPVSGPKDWLTYGRYGLGALGAALLLILFL